MAPRLGSFSLRTLAKTGFLAGCLLPAAFVAYPAPRRWLEAIRSRTFFRAILHDVDGLLAKVLARGPLSRWLVGLPLRLAQAAGPELHFGRGVVRLYRQGDLGKILGLFGVAPRPGPVSLLPGLLDPDSPGHATAVTAAWNALTPLPPLRTATPPGSSQSSCPDFSGTVAAVVVQKSVNAPEDQVTAWLCLHGRRLGWKIVLVRASAAGSKPSWADAVVVGPGGTAAGWGAALAALPSLYACAELILCDDTVFDGVGSYAYPHGRMAAVDCDFWGLVENQDGLARLEPFHLVLRPAALRHQALTEFFQRVPDEPEAARRWQLRFALWLALHGLRPGAFVPCGRGCPGHWDRVMDAGVPALKRASLLPGKSFQPIGGWKERVLDAGYPLNLILDWANHLGHDLTPALHASAGVRTWPPCVQACYTPPVVAPGSQSRPKRSPTIGVFAHVYYPDLADELLSFLANVPGSASLFLSTDTLAKQTNLAEKCAARGWEARATISVFPNRGWDIAPFLVGFAARIPQFDLILRLHAKRSPQLPGHAGTTWRHLLCESLAGTPEQVTRILDLFQTNDRLGLVCPPIVPHYADSLDFGGNFALMRNILAIHGLRIRPNTPIDFPMGSMFWCRPRILAPWLARGWDFVDFAPTQGTVRDGTLAHALERLFFFGCALEGYSWTRIFPPGSTI